MFCFCSVINCKLEAFTGSLGYNETMSKGKKRPIDVQKDKTYWFSPLEIGLIRNISGRKLEITPYKLHLVMESLKQNVFSPSELNN